MRLNSALFLNFLFFAAVATAQTPAAVPTCAELHLVPAPRECVAVTAIPIGGVGFFVAAGGAEDGFAAEDLSEQSLGRRQVQKDAPFIRLERADSPPAKRCWSCRLKPDAPMRRVHCFDARMWWLAVIAETAAGIFGVQAVKAKRSRGSGKNRVLLAPTLRDYYSHGASRTLRRLVARAAAQHGLFEARSSRTALQAEYHCAVTLTTTVPRMQARRRRQRFPAEP